VATKRDFALVWPRTEYHCARCGGHQGHRFADGPRRPARATATTAWRCASSPPASRCPPSGADDARHVHALLRRRHDAAWPHHVRRGPVAHDAGRAAAGRGHLRGRVLLVRRGRLREGRRRGRRGVGLHRRAGRRTPRTSRSRRGARGTSRRCRCTTTRRA
jgi:hypothetical protein